MSANGLGIEPDEFVVAFDNVSSIPFCAILELFPRAREGRSPSSTIADETSRIGCEKRGYRNLWTAYR